MVQFISYPSSKNYKTSEELVQYLTWKTPLSFKVPKKYLLAERHKARTVEWREKTEVFQSFGSQCRVWGWETKRGDCRINIGEERVGAD